MSKENQGSQPEPMVRFDAATHLTYDEADLRAIRADAHKVGFNEDDNSVYFARQLDFVKARAYDRKFPEMKGNLLVPVATDVPEYAETVTTRVFDEVGIAKVISNYADDLPRADVRAREFSTKVWTIGDSYGYNINELRASQATGAGLDTRKATAARRAIEQKLNRISLRGDPDFGLFGLLNHPNVAKVVAQHGDWANAATTGDHILADLNLLYLSIVNQSNGIHRPNFLALPAIQLAHASTKIVAETMGETALSFFLKQHPGVQVEEVYEMKGAGTGNTDVMFMYERNEENLWHDLVMPFNQLPPEARNLEFVVPCMARTGGVQIQYPLAFGKMEGI